MANAYVGIAELNRLRILVPETEHAAVFLQRRIIRRRMRQAMCFWAVLDEKIAKEIMQSLAIGEQEQALQLFNESVIVAGRIVSDPGCRQEQIK